MIWVLIMTLNSGAFSENDYAALATQEFTSEQTCEHARAEYEKAFDKATSNTLAICVQK